MHSAAVMIVVLSAHAALPLRGVVLGTDGAPAEQTRLFLYAAPQWTWEEPEAAIEGRTGKDGEFGIAPESPTRPLFSNLWHFLLAYKPGVGIAIVEVASSCAPASRRTLKLRPTSDVRLRVLDPQGGPVSDVEVQLTSVQFSERQNWALPALLDDFKFRTNAQGETALKGVPRGCGFSVRVTTEAFGVQQATLGGQVDSYIVHLRPVAEVRGRLIIDDFEAGRQIPISVISQPPGAGADQRTSGYARVHADSEGRFVVRVAEGNVWVPDVPIHPKSRYLTTENLRFPIAAGETREIEIKCVRGIRVSRNVVEEGSLEPVTGAKAMLSWQIAAPRARMLEVVADTDVAGEVEFFVPAPGTVQINVHAVPAPFIRHSSLWSGLTTLRPGDDDCELDPCFVRRGVALSGVVADEKDRPVPNALVQATWVVAGPTAGNTVDHAWALADARGRFVLEPVSDLNAVFLTAADDTRGSVEPTAVEPWNAEAQTSIRLKIEPAGMISIAGRVVDAQGQGIEGAEIELSYRLLWPDGKADLTCSPVTAIAAIATDAKGRFRTAPLPRLASYSIGISAAGYAHEEHHVHGPDQSETSVALPDITLARAER